MSLFVSRAQSPEYPWSPTPNASPDLVDDSISLGVEDTPRATPQPVQRFRFRSRYCILTYSQTDAGFNPQGIVDCVHTDGGLCVIGREQHADGGTHFHAFVDYLRIRDWTGATRWDVGRHHPNCNPVSRTPHRAFSYAIKDGDVVHDDFDESTRPKGPIGDRRRGNGASKRNFAEITDAVDKEDFLLKCKNLIRELWFVRLETLQNSQIGSFRIHEDDTSNLQESQFPSSPPAWFENSEEDWENLVGETPPAPAGASLPPLRSGGNPSAPRFISQLALNELIFRVEAGPGA